MKTIKLTSYIIATSIFINLACCATNAVGANNLPTESFSKKYLEPVNTLDKINISFPNIEYFLEHQGLKSNTEDKKLPTLNPLVATEVIKLGKSILKTAPILFIKNNINSLAIDNPKNEAINSETLKHLLPSAQANDDVLIFQPIKSTHNCNKDCVAQFTIGAALYDTKLSQVVWKGLVTLPTQPSTLTDYDDIATKLTEELIVKMKEDGILKFAGWGE